MEHLSFDQSPNRSKDSPQTETPAGQSTGTIQVETTLPNLDASVECENSNQTEESNSAIEE